MKHRPAAEVPSSESSRPRLPYEKPLLRTLDLAAEEVLSVGCKMATSSGPIPPTCLSSVCSADGS